MNPVKFEAGRKNPSAEKQDTIGLTVYVSPGKLIYPAILSKKRKRVSVMLRRI
jgi:hypothetical protein